MKDPFQRLIETIKALTAEVEQETAALRAGAVGQLASLTTRKQQAATAYEGALQAMVEQAHLMSKLPPPARQDLHAAARRLEAALDENSLILTATREASARLIGRIMEAASQKSSAGGYTAAGKLTFEPTNVVSRYRERV
jgi:hypothetical protein